MFLEKNKEILQMSNLFEELNKLNEKYIGVWKDVCEIESPTNCKEGVDRVGEYFIKMAEEQGFSVEVFKHEKAGNVVDITLNPDVNNKPITFSGHIDTVHPIGFFKEPIVRIDDENIYGPGVSDCKGGVVGAFMAMEALKRCGFNKRPVKLLLQTDEEVGSKISNKETIKYICEKAKDSVAFLNCEPGSDNGKLVLTRKGILRYRIDIKGKAAHSAFCMDGCSAIAEAARMLLKLEELKDGEGLTCNCGIISGGTTPNTVAETCSFMADIRFSTEEEEKEANRIITELVNSPENPDCKCSFELVSDRPCMPSEERNFELLRKMNEIFEQNNMRTYEATKGWGGADGAYATKYGIPCVDKMGVFGGGEHSINEYAKLSSLLVIAKRLAVVAYNI